MTLAALVSLAASRQASDLHLEVGLPATIRRQGELVSLGDPLSHEDLEAMLREVIDPQAWDEYLHRRSHDVSRVIAGVRCRINALYSRRGPGLAVRLLPGATPTLSGLNLHPDLVELVVQRHGLILVSGPTGSGKSSTLAALLQEINLHQRRHVVTIEEPIEYRLRPAKAFIRQREVGRDTPSFEQALVDALRQDPDVLMVGELREPEVMRLTLNAAETGHLVLATVHSATAAEALQRLVNAFPAEIQRGVAGQLADCLLAVVCQRLIYREDIDLRIPECEILRATSASRSIIRQLEFSKLTSVLETGGGDGMYTWARYRAWLDARRTWSRAVTAQDAPEEDAADAAPRAPLRSPAEGTGRGSWETRSRGASGRGRPSHGGASGRGRPSHGGDSGRGRPSHMADRDDSVPPSMSPSEDQATVFEIDLGADLQSVAKDLVDDD